MPARILAALTAIYKFKPLWYAAAIFAIAVGFDFKTPATHFKELDHTDSLTSERMKDIEQEHSNIERYLKALSTAQCLDRPRRETLLMGLDCPKLLHEGGGGQ